MVFLSKQWWLCLCCLLPPLLSASPGSCPWSDGNHLAVASAGPPPILQQHLLVGPEGLRFHDCFKDVPSNCTVPSSSHSLSSLASRANAPFPLCMVVCVLGSLALSSSHCLTHTVLPPLHLTGEQSNMSFPALMSPSTSAPHQLATWSSGGALSILPALLQPISHIVQPAPFQASSLTASQAVPETGMCSIVTSVYMYSFLFQLTNNFFELLVWWNNNSTCIWFIDALQWGWVPKSLYWWSLAVHRAQPAECMPTSSAFSLLSTPSSSLHVIFIPFSVSLCIMNGACLATSCRHISVMLLLPLISECEFLPGAPCTLQADPLLTLWTACPSFVPTSVEHQL